MAEEGGQRLFFALWPDDLCRERLARQARRLHGFYGGRITESTSLHLTLVFLGDVSAEQVNVMRGVGDHVAMRGFTLHMAGAGCWSHNQIAWVAPAITPEPLARLVGDLREAVVAAGIQVESRPFSPHVTLLRKAQCRPVDSKAVPFEWRVNDFVLLRSTLHSEGARYEIVERWSTAPAPSSPEHE